MATAAKQTSCWRMKLHIPTPKLSIHGLDLQQFPGSEARRSCEDPAVGGPWRSFRTEHTVGSAACLRQLGDAQCSRTTTRQSRSSGHMRQRSACKLFDRAARAGLRAQKANTNERYVKIKCTSCRDPRDNTRRPQTSAGQLCHICWSCNAGTTDRGAMGRKPRSHTPADRAMMLPP